MRAAARQGGTRLASVRTQLRGVALLDVDRELLDDAGLLRPCEVRSLDAIHVAAALAIGPDLGVVITYDQRMADAARGQGLGVVGPA